MSWPRRLVGSGVLFAAAALAAPVGAAGEALAIESADGFVLRSTYYRGADERPGILLLHQCNRDRASLDALGEALAERGFHALALDFRGFGESVGGEVRDFRSQREALWPSFPADVDAALDALLSRPGVRAGAVGALGASCGGTQQVLLSLREPRLAALVFLSSSVSGIDETVRREFLSDRDMPLFVIAAEDDSRTAEVAEELFAGSANLGTRLTMYKGDAHGVPLFELDPSLPGQIVDWFARQF